MPKLSKKNKNFISKKANKKVNKKKIYTRSKTYSKLSKKKGGGRAIVNEVYKMVKKSNHLSRLVTLSPLTKMARNFHIKNGAEELQVNETTQNFEYDITLEEWETALVKAKKFLKIS